MLDFNLAIKRASAMKEMFCSEADIVHGLATALGEQGAKNNSFSFECRYPLFNDCKFVDLKVEEENLIHWLEFKYFTKELKGLEVDGQKIIRCKTALSEKFLLDAISDIERVERLVKWPSVKEKKKYKGHVIWINCNEGITNPNANTPYADLYLFQGNNLKTAYNLRKKTHPLQEDYIISWRGFNTTPIVLIEDDSDMRLEDSGRFQFYYNYFCIE